MVVAAEKCCPKCKSTKPVEEFHKNKLRADGLDFYCKTCGGIARRSYYQENRAKCLASHAEYSRKNRFRISLSQARYTAKKKGYMECLATEEEIKDAFTGFCAICGKEEGKRKLCMDHDHCSGEFRGWLCSGCNKGLGGFKDSPENLIRAAQFLRDRQQSLFNERE